jgi:hypothetical protein
VGQWSPVLEQEGHLNKRQRHSEGMVLILKEGIVLCNCAMCIQWGASMCRRLTAPSIYHIECKCNYCAMYVG